MDDAIRERLLRWKNDPIAFFIEALGMDRAHIWGKMQEIAYAVRDNRHVAIKAGHGCSKTYNLARLCLWYLYNHYPCTVITTAPSDVQVEQLLWREIRDAHRMAKFDLGGKLLKTSLELEEKWFAIGFSTKPDQGQEHATRFQGFHNEHVMVIFDEAAGVMKQIWAAKDFLMTNERAKFVAVGNPSMATGDFVDCFSSPVYKKITVSVLDTPNYQHGREVIPGISGREFVDYMRTKFGEDSNQWKSRVLGEIPDSNANGLLKKKWILDAEGAQKVRHDTKKIFLTWDVADGGNDDNVIKAWENTNELESLCIKGKDIESTIPSVLRLLRKHKANAVIVDADGVGRIAVGLLESAVEPSIEIIPFEGSSKDVTDTELFRNKRDEGHWRMRDLFSNRHISLLRNNEVQREELEVLCLADDNKGYLAMEKKDNIKKLLAGRSPNFSDCIMMMAACIDDVPPIERYSDDLDYYMRTSNEDYYFHNAGMAV